MTFFLVFFNFKYTSDNQRLIKTVSENCLCLLAVALYEHQLLVLSLLYIVSSEKHF